MLIKRDKKQLLIHGVLHKLNIVHTRDDSGKRCLTVSLTPYNKGFPRFYYINNSRIRELSIQEHPGIAFKLAGQSMLEVKARVIKELIKA